MGVPFLDTFIRKAVPNGFFKINIETEIRKHCSSALNPSPPVIVFDLKALFCRQFFRAERKPQLCGGQYTLEYGEVARLFGKFKELGVSLEFFCDGPLADFEYEAWGQEQDERHAKQMAKIDAVDGGKVQTLSRLEDPVPPYTFKEVAKRYGTLHMTMGKKRDQKMAAFANKVGAMAVMSYDTDFLIFGGSWRYWAIRELNFDSFETMEYNRVGLVEYLDLDFNRMPLFATLCGSNDFLLLEEVEKFHGKMNNQTQKNENFESVADFVRRQPMVGYHPEDFGSVLSQACGKNWDSFDLKIRFIKSLDFYDPNYSTPSLNPTNDPFLATFLELGSSFAYHVWHGTPVPIPLYMVDLRRNDFGQQVPYLLIHLMRRMAGLILRHRSTINQVPLCSFYTKLDDLSSYAQHDFPVEEIPSHVRLPNLSDLFSKNPFIRSDQRETKLQLLCWIVTGSDNNTLNYQLLEPIPKKLWTTVLTLYFLVQNQVIKLFEADLLLQIAHDVTAGVDYDAQSVANPARVESHPFRLVFCYTQVYELFREAIDLVGLQNDRSDPPFDGMLFHNRYADWSRQTDNLKQIEQWRIYVDADVAMDM